MYKAAEIRWGSAADYTHMVAHNEVKSRLTEGLNEV